jgi:anti-sigma B factor antagonist
VTGPFTTDSSVDTDTGLATIAVAGELDTSSAGSFVDAVQAVLAQGHRDLLVDLRKLEFIDSSGLRSLLLARRAVEEVAGGLTFTRSTPAVERLFAVTHFDSVFRFIQAAD